MPKNNRFNLRCLLCPNRGGVCIQCSFKSCRSTYHVTCAQKCGLQLLTVPEFQSYCLKHADPCRQMESPDPLSQTNNHFTNKNNADRLAVEAKDWITNTRHLFLQTNFSLSEYTAQSILIYWRLKKLE
uniref:PHD-type domain-containing protein n=1 Tax=Romanomermis culicivorax TaxID=13658 RepID=A0A915JCZ9_ROMCU